MTKWCEVRLGNMCELKRGYDLPSSQRRSGAVPIVSSSGTTGWHDTAKVAGPGVVTGRYGTLGEVYFVEDDFWPLNTALYVRDFRGNDRRFVYYLLKATNLGNSESAAAVPGVNRNVLHELRVKQPDREAQHRIAGVLTAFDELIENNRRRIEILEEAARSLYREWFGRYRFPGHETADFIDSSLGPIPRGWGVGPLAKVAELCRTSVSPVRFPDEVFAHCSIPAYDAGQLPELEVGASIKSGKYLITQQVVLVSKLNPRIRRVWLVRPEVGHRTISSTEFLPLACFRPGRNAFLYGLASSERFGTAIIGLAGGTSTSHQRTKPDDFLAVSIIIPSDPIVLAYEERAMPCLEAAGCRRTQNRLLAAARDLLLPKLVTGAIDVDSLGVDDVFGWAEMASKPEPVTT